MKLLFPLEPGKNCSKWAFVGSRVTCDPAPTDTDRDVLVLCVEGEVGDLANKMYEAGGELCGESYSKDDDTIVPIRLGVDNYLLTGDREYFYRFLAVTAFAKDMNFMDKAVRKQLFAAAMDSVGCEVIDVNSAPIDPEGLF